MRTAIRTKEIKAIPALPTVLVRAALTRKQSQGVAEFQPLQLEVQGALADPTKLARFRKVCDLPETGFLPVTYPQVMAFPLHLQLMLEPEFPFSPIGAVHLRNRIEQHRAIGVEEALDFQVKMGDARQVAKGYEIDLITEARSRNELVWEAVSVILVRKGGSGARQSRPSQKEETFEYSVDWDLPATLGREYASASGDYNPIHLFPLTAKLMGFRRHIIHGMWSKSRILAALMPRNYEGAVTAEVTFKLPVYLPGKVRFMYRGESGAFEFALKDGKGRKPHLSGSLNFTAPSQE
ncbi:MaoC family dehydratase [Biformimicrobium ophioploci]|uniref:MaoC/PaaZ C-terminal domain-containing protein n=1 Tax=Biformimicrobium ophioploci TaxID=3036711 RepID=A0ABQ6LY87_9GAMM|nr:MaoC/PaaZ C-terminal domain-containing protein [Microbulbifer sp. NKW57]GMG87069.1 MaoC/PaaZ C-terminal domain-containing protein [Microbulbifer sp. NKW57]